MKSLFIGDLHIDDGYKGRHKDYLANCKKVLKDLDVLVKAEQPTHIFLSGDVIGVNTGSRLLKSRDTLLYVIEMLQRWNDITAYNVYSLVGNHDIFDKTGDFEVLKRLGLIKNPDKVDLGNAVVHFFNYGEDDKKIELVEGKANIGLMHTGFMIDGYRGLDARVLFKCESVNDMVNLSGLDLIILGHIHKPSELITTYIDGEPVRLVYLGCPTRPRKEPLLWNFVNVVTVEDGDCETDVKTTVLRFGLEDYNELYVNAFDDICEIDDDEGSINNVEALVEILDELKEYTIDNGMDYIVQIKKYEKVDKAGVEKAVGYIEQVKSEG